MLESASPLKRTALGSALGNTSMLRPRAGGGHRRSMVASLMLTSLVDAFSILVIFLIMNHSASNEVVNVGSKVTLPQARESQFIQSGVVVRIEGGKFLVEDKEVALGNLTAQLKALNSSVEMAKREGLIYGELNSTFLNENHWPPGTDVATQYLLELRTAAGRKAYVLLPDLRGGSYQVPDNANRSALRRSLS